MAEQQQSFREKYSSLWDNALLNPMGTITKNIDPTNKSGLVEPMERPSTVDQVGNVVGGTVGNVVGTNAGVRAIEPVLGMIPDNKYTILPKTAARMLGGYLGGRVGGGVGSGITEAALSPLSSEDKTVGEHFVQGYRKGDEASSSLLNLLNVPFLPSKGMKDRIPQIPTEIAQEIIGTNVPPRSGKINTARNYSPQTPIEWATEKIRPGIPQYNPEEVVMKGKGVDKGLPGVEPTTVKDIQDLQMKEKGQPLSEAFIGDPNSSNASIIRSAQRGRVRERNQATLADVENRVANVDNPQSVFGEIMPKTVDKPTQLDEVQMANRYGPTMRRAKEESNILFRQHLHDFTIATRDPQTGQRYETSFPQTSLEFHRLAKANATHPDYEKTYGKIKQLAETGDNYQKPLARALVYGEPIPIEDAIQLRTSITGLGNPTHGANRAGLNDLPTAFDTELNNGVVGQYLPQAAKSYNDAIVHYKDTSPFISYDTVPAQASQQANRFFNPDRFTEPKLKFDTFMGDNPQAIQSLMQASKAFKGKLTATTAQKVEKLANEVRQWRLNKFFDESRGKLEGTSALKSEAQAWEKMDRDTAAALVGEENIEKVNTLMATALKVANSGGANPEKIMHMGRWLQAAGAAAASGAVVGNMLTGGSAAGGAGGALTSSLIYYAIAYGYPAVRSRIISSPKLMNWAIHGFHANPTQRLSSTALVQFLEQSGLDEQLKNEYNTFSQWSKKTGKGVVEYFKNRNSGEIKLPPPSQHIEVPQEGTITVDPHKDIDSYLKQFGQ